MAFENVFGNINWSMPVQAKLAKEAQFANMLGRAMDQLNLNKQMDMRERQMEQQQAAKANDPKNLAQEAIINKIMAQEGVTREQAAMKLMYGLEKAAFDPYSGRVTRTPSVMDQLGLGGGAPQAIPQAAPVQAGGAVPFRFDTQQEAPANPLFYDAKQGGDIQPVDMNLADVEQALGVPQDQAPRQQTDLDMMMPFDKRPQYSPSAPGPMKSTTEKAIAVEGDLKKKAGELLIEDEFQKERERRAKKSAKEEALPQEALKIRSSFQEAENLNATIKDVYDNASFFTTGYVGQKTKDVGGAPAHDLAANLKTIEADSGLSKLIEVKDRGGTFGALQEKELELLIASRAALLQTQGTEQFKENLVKYQQQRNKTMRVMADFYKDKFGELPEGLMEGLSKNIIKPETEKKIEQAKRGKVFRNPQTGERIKWQDGQWIKIQ